MQFKIVHDIIYSIIKEKRKGVSKLDIKLEKALKQLDGDKVPSCLVCHLRHVCTIHRDLLPVVDDADTYSEIFKEWIPDAGSRVFAIFAIHCRLYIHNPNVDNEIRLTKQRRDKLEKWLTIRTFDRNEYC